MVYDQGRDKLAPQAAGDKYVKIYSFVTKAGHVTFNSDVKISIPGTTITTLYDVFAWNNAIIITSINANSPALVSMSSCIIDAAVTNLSCATKDSVYTTTPTGYIGLGHTFGEIVIYKPTSASQGNLAVYDIKGTFPTDWLNKIAEFNYKLGRDLPPNSYPKDYIGNDTGGVIQFVGKVQADLCIIAHSNILNATYWYGQATAVYQSRNLLIVDIYKPKQGKSQIRTNAYRLDWPFAIVKAEQLSDDPLNYFQIQISDAYTSKLFANKNVYRINSDSVATNISFIPPRFDTFDQSTITFPFFDTNVISGNNLRFNVEFQTKEVLPDNIQNIFGKATSNQKFGLDMTMHSEASFNNFKFMAWTQGAAIAQSANGDGFILYCTYPSEQEVNCGEATKFQFPENYELQEYAVSDQGFIVGSAVNSIDGKMFLIVSSLYTRTFATFPLQIFNKDFAAKDVNIFSYDYMDSAGVVNNSFYISVATFNRETRVG